MNQEIRAVEEEIGKLTERLAMLRRDADDTADVPNYKFETLTGEVSLRDLFLGKQTLCLPFTTWVRVVGTAPCGLTD
jgi:predicted dithiol-disulfide oxidoreductase (DUF899 family)